MILAYQLVPRPEPPSPPLWSYRHMSTCTGALFQFRPAYRISGIQHCRRSSAPPAPSASIHPLCPPLPPSFLQLHEVRQGLVKLNGRLEAPLPSIGNFLAFLHEWLLY